MTIISHEREMNAERCLNEWKAESQPAMAPLLIAWYDLHARDLPWRALPTPYRVWVSEIMLQQTRVEAVLPYFERFTAALPDVAALANAEESTIMKLWEGLGYYSRVRNMQSAARMVMQNHGGALPGTAEELQKLPGIGEYTAGAIASIAFGERTCAVDGNVLRVLSRLTASAADISKPETKQAFRLLALSLLPQDRPGDFNQAVMDLGATICLPNGEPLCGRCPLAELCKGRMQGIAGDLPVKAAKKPREVKHRAVFVIRCGGKVLLHRRVDTGLLAGLWELPGSEGWLEEAQAMEALHGFGVKAGSIRRIEDAKHIFTHIEWLMQGWLAEVEEFPAQSGFAWVGGRALTDSFTMPGAFKAYRKYLPE